MIIIGQALDQAQILFELSLLINRTSNWEKQTIEQNNKRKFNKLNQKQ